MQGNSKKLEYKLGFWRKRLHVLTATISQLETSLGDVSGANDDALDLFDDEDMDILSQKHTPEEMDTT